MFLPWVDGSWPSRPMYYGPDNIHQKKNIHKFIIHYIYSSGNLGMIQDIKQNNEALFFFWWPQRWHIKHTKKYSQFTSISLFIIYVKLNVTVTLSVAGQTMHRVLPQSFLPMVFGWTHKVRLVLLQVLKPAQNVKRVKTILQERKAKCSSIAALTSVLEGTGWHTRCSPKLQAHSPP